MVGNKIINDWIYEKKTDKVISSKNYSVEKHEQKIIES